MDRPPFLFACWFPGFVPVGAWLKPRSVLWFWSKPAPCALGAWIAYRKR